MTTSTSRPTWIALLAGPSIWFGHFMGVYLLAEAACAADSTGPQVLGLSLLSFSILAATALAVGVVLIAVVRTISYRRQQTGGDGPTTATRNLLWLGLLLDGLFIIAILFTGLPVLVLNPC